jgi:vacuolar-type H+-ATPase subunit E/Vma4
MSIQDILDKILSSAKITAQEIVTEARISAEKLREEVLLSGEKEREALSLLTDEKIKKAMKKSEYLAHMEAKNTLLTVKSNFIESVLSGIVEKFSTLPAKEYEQKMTQLMNMIPETEGTIYPAMGKENSTKGAIKLAFKNFKLGEARKFSGGFVLETPQADYDYSFETLIKDTLRKEIEESVLSSIF